MQKPRFSFAQLAEAKRRQEQAQAAAANELWREQKAAEHAARARILAGLVKFAKIR